MLIAGNCRSVTGASPRSIRDAIWAAIVASRDVYEWVAQLCSKLGAAPGDMVAFERYAEAARSLTLPSSLARGLANGAVNVERIDLLIQLLAEAQGQHLEALDRLVQTITLQLFNNRASPTRLE